MFVSTVRKVFAVAALSFCLSLASGCVVVVSAGCDWDRSPAVWVEETAQVQVESAGLTALDVRTHNGEIEFTGQAPGSPATATLKKKAGGSSQEDAHEAMAAIEIIAERSPSGEQKLGWRWKGVKKSRWVGEVAFKIQAPGNLRFEAETHNGEVQATGVIGDTKVTTHNGAVRTDSRDGKLEAITHNGAISATYCGPSITLETHNGEIKADLSHSTSVRGDISTHNGAIQLAVGTSTNADLTAETDNGKVSYDVPIQVQSAGKSRLEGKLGAGGERLELTTNNGAINIKAGG